MDVLITGAAGFIGRNLAIRLEEMEGVHVHKITSSSSISDLDAALARAEFIFHLAGANRPTNPDHFKTVNADFTATLCERIKAARRKIPILFSSSIQAGNVSPYGDSKLAAESTLRNYGRELDVPVLIYRLPNIFGKWCRPNYNSVVATFCHNTAHGLPLQINNTATVLQLNYIDDVVTGFIIAMSRALSGQETSNCEISPRYEITLGELAAALEAFRDSKQTLITERVGTGLTRALYATYVSYLPPQAFSYEVPKYGDARGEFVEMLKTHDSGQFSYFTAHPGITRGGHYHHSKTEKFLVIRGEARFGFRHIVTDETFEIRTSGSKPEIVETIPGWTHDITNVGTNEMIVMLWANEIFDRDHPDTIAKPVSK
ncbi:UDP-2-acetamido-2,6-beta-L-arabino-hexul-4-ose reductase [Herbaspirillum robiniae]|uniref:UDP-2-acetamido-2,6-beta-L-arabino-hexul-4-ose reductase n=1 Tax=Herbaspirillum robiniae TaxID=2014887 RepID=UPI003D771399